MNKQEYNNVIETTIAQQTGEKDSLETTREVLNNMGAVLPQGDLQQVSEGLATEDYMGWRKCSVKEAQEYANEGTAVVAIGNEQIALVAANDDDGEGEVAVTSAAVMTLDENTPALAVADMAFYANSRGSTQNDQYTMYNDYFMYRLVITFNFLESEARLLRILYDKINSTYAGSNTIEKAWMFARMIGGIVYGTTFLRGVFWHQVAGHDVSLTSSSTNRQLYFTTVLGYTATEYQSMEAAILRQHREEDTPDFAHMNMSLACRLAYYLDLDKYPSDLIEVFADEDISYLGGWLGDAVLWSDYSAPTMKNDDYCADLDAENIYRLIITNKTLLDAVTVYYTGLVSNNTRADVFLSYIPLSKAMLKILQYLNITGESPAATLKANYPDTYNFIMSLNSRLEHMAIF